MLSKLRTRLVAYFSLFSLLLNLASPFVLAATYFTPTPAFAQETEEATSSPISSPDPSVEPSVDPTPSPEPSPEPSIAPSPAPTESLAPAATLTATVTEEPAPPPADEFDLETTEPTSASLATDKPDYTPSEVVTVSGDGYSPSTQYRIAISSQDDPAITHEDSVTTDADGHLSYSYQLDDNFRPNYLVEVFDLGGVLISSTTFTDHSNFNVNINGGDITTSSLNVILNLSWSTGWLSPDPAEARYANDTNGGNCNDLGGGTWTSWEPITETGGNSSSRAWVLDATASEKRVCVESRHPRIVYGNHTLTASDTIFYASTNPPLSQACGLDIALVLDNSNSISTSEMNQLKSAMTNLVDTLAGTPTHFSVVKFGNSASVLQTMTGDVAAVKTAINSLSHQNEATNWIAGLQEGHNSFGGRANPNLLIFATDGNPTAPDFPYDSTNGIDLSGAITESSNIKTAGTRILALGIGNGLDIVNLQAISGPVVGTDLSADVITTDFAGLASALADFAGSTCGGTITVHKLLDADGDLTTTGDQTDGSGWDFSILGVTSATTDDDGLVNFDLTGSQTVVVSETLPTGYELLNAVCLDQNQSNQGSFVTQSDPPIYGVEQLSVGPTNIISCTFINHELPKTGSITGYKWNDQNKDGNWDGGEPGLLNWSILSFSTLGSHTTGSTSTLADGSYTIDNLNPGHYYVCEGLGGPNTTETWLQSYPSSGSQDGNGGYCHYVEVVAGQVTENVNFGNYQYLPFCGDGIKNGQEACDGADGIDGNSFCTTNCQLVPIYRGGTTCSNGKVPGDNMYSGLISSTDPVGQIIGLDSGKEYLFQASGTFIPTSAPGYLSDAGFTWINSVLAGQYGIYGTPPDLGAHALLGDLGLGVGIIDWGSAASDNKYSFVYTTSIDPVQFVIGDRYSDWFDTPWQNQSGMNDNQGSLQLDIYECVAPPVTVNAQKVVCDSEEYLPNWGNHGAVIGESTAADYVAAHSDHCQLEQMWQFQWAPSGGSFGAFQTDTSQLGDPWTTFTAGSTEIPFSAITSNRIEVREVETCGPMVPFSNDPGSVGSSESSEFYCTGDVYNYDNWEWINNPQAGDTYHCVAFNARATSTVKVCKEDSNHNPLTGWKVGLSVPTGFESLIPVTDGAGLTTPLGDGAYVVYASGTYRYGNSAMIADAGYSFRPLGIPHGTGGWVNGDALSHPGGLELNLSGGNITDSNINWGGYNPNHQYSAYLTGWGANDLTLSIWDDYYGDNVNNGSFRAQIDKSVASGFIGEDGCATFDNVPYGDYNVFEVPKSGWYYQSTTVGSDTITSYPAQVTVGTQVPEITLTNAPSTGSVYGAKYTDLNQNHTRDEGENGLGGWDIYLRDPSAPATPLATTTTSSDGSYRFDNVPAGEYLVCEDPSRASDNWVQREPNSGTLYDGWHCYNLSLPPGAEYGGYNFGNFQYGSAFVNKYEDLDWQEMRSRANSANNLSGAGDEYPVCEGITMSSSGYKVAVETGNSAQPQITIAKSNDADGPVGPGAKVKFTLVLKLLGSKLLGVKLTDLFPHGFSYVEGSWTSSLGGVPEPSYHSPGVWELGDMNPGDEVTLTYLAEVGSDVDSGIYKDLAWATGNSNAWGTVYAQGVDSTYTSGSFAGSEVEVSKDSRGGIGVDVEGEVLGASTSTVGELPATGADTKWLVLAIAFLTLGLTLLFSRRSKLLALAFILGLGLIFPNSTYAYDDPSLAVVLEEPKSPTSDQGLTLAYTILDVEDRAVTVRCYKKGPTDGSYSQFDSATLAGGGNNGVCETGSSVLNSRGDYSFYVTANAGSDEEASNTVSLFYETEAPGTPENYRKEHPSECRYIIKFKTAGDSDKTKRVEIYRSMNVSFTADPGTMIAGFSAESDKDYEHIHDFAGDCDKTWYYAVRAFNDAGQGSGIVGDQVTIVTTSGTTEVVTAGAVPVSSLPGGTVLGQETPSQEQSEQTDQSGEVLGEVTPSEEPVSASSLQDVVTSAVTGSHRWYLLIGILAGLGIVFYVVRLFTKP